MCMRMICTAENVAGAAFAGLCTFDSSSIRSLSSLQLSRLLPTHMPVCACLTHVGGDAVRRRTRARDIGRLRRARQGRKDRLHIAVQDVRLRHVGMQKRRVFRGDEVAAQAYHIEDNGLLRTVFSHFANVIYALQFSADSLVFLVR